MLKNKPQFLKIIERFCNTSKLLYNRFLKILHADILLFCFIKDTSFIITALFKKKCDFFSSIMIVINTLDETPGHLKQERLMIEIWVDLER